MDTVTQVQEMPVRLNELVIDLKRFWPEELFFPATIGMRVAQLDLIVGLTDEMHRQELKRMRADLIAKVDKLGAEGQRLFNEGYGGIIRTVCQYKSPYK